MNRYGMGTPLFRATLMYGLLAVFYDVVFESILGGRLVPWHLGAPTGAVLCGLGILVYALGLGGVTRARNEGRLATGGIYAVVRHPLYAGWIWGIVPGLALLWGRPLILAAPVVALVFYRLLVPHEEAHLLERFGQAYHDYRRRVGGILPRPSPGAGS